MKNNQEKFVISKSNQILNTLNTAYESKNIDLIKKIEKKHKLDLLINAINEISDIDMIIFIMMITKEETTRILFKNLFENIQNGVLENSSQAQAKIIINSLFPDEVVDIIKSSNENIKKKILLSLNPNLRNQIKEIEEYHEDEAGSLMNPEFLSFVDTMTIKECLLEYKKNHDNLENDLTFFITNSYGMLLGSVSINNLIFAETYKDPINSIMNQNVLYTSVNDDIEEIINKFQECELNNLPVVDDELKLVGVINHADILPALEDETTEDIYNMYGIKELKYSYMKSSVLSIVKSRVFWIVILMISATFTSIVINLFDNWGASITAGVSSVLLVPIIPVITGTSGNAGSQSVASVVRSLSIGEVTKKEYSKIIKKEFMVGCLLGFILFLVNFARLLIFFAIPAFRMNDPLQSTQANKLIAYSECAIISAATSLALWLAIILSKTLGAILPIIAFKLGKDPTVMSAPLIATILDVCSTSILFGIGIGVIVVIQNLPV